MPGFFSKPSNVLVEHEITLIEYQAKKVAFNPQDIQHTKLISDCAQSVRDKLTLLQEIDKKMVIGFAVGTAGFIASWFLPLAVVAIGGFAYAAYQVAQRQHAYAQYTHALENLAKCCVWTLGDLGANEIRKNEIKNNPAIREMIATLAPLTSSEQLREFIDAKAGAEYDKDAEEIRADSNLFDEHLDKEKADLYYKIYGYKQGGFMAILEGIKYAIQKGFQAIKNAFGNEEPEATFKPA